MNFLGERKFRMETVHISEILFFLKQRGINFRFYGDAADEIEGFSALDNYKKGTITWIKKPYMVQEECLNIKLAVTEVNSKLVLENLIEVDNSKGVFFEILQNFWMKEKPCGICEDSVIKTKRIGKNIFVGHNCFIGEDVVLEDDIYIGNNVQVECPCYIGSNSRIASGVVIGTDGFGFFQNEKGNYCKVPHFGGVVIGKNVEIGANTCIDRGTIDNTYIGDNVKIDNLCHVAHNVKIGNNSLVIALSMLGGSSVIGENGYIAPGCLIKNQVMVEKGAMVGMGTVVLKDVPRDKVVVGVPARIIKNRGETE